VPSGVRGLFYQTTRLKESAAPKTVNEEVGFLLRLLGDVGEAIRGRMRRQRKLKLATPRTAGRAFSEDEKNTLLNAARSARSHAIYPALMLALNTAMRDLEIRMLKWSQIDFEHRFLTVGKSKTVAGEGRTFRSTTVSCRR
jgi:integrase